MEWLFLILWLLIINGALSGQYILNWMGNQKEYTGGEPVTISSGVMTWWREISKFAWVFIAVIVEIARGKKMKYFWPGLLSMSTIMICAFTGVIENIGFFYLPKYYSPHVYAPYVNVYLVFLPLFGKILFNAPIRKEHWIGISLVVIGLTVPHFPRMFGKTPDPSAILDWSAIVWIIIINACLCSQQILNNKTVQTAFKGVEANALVLWREIWKLVFITAALVIFPLMANAWRVHVPEQAPAAKFESLVLSKVDSAKKAYILTYYHKEGDNYKIAQNLPKETESNIKSIISTTGYDRFFSLFEGSLLPNNWIPILFVIAAGLTGYIYSFGFFKLSRFAAHFWVPYTNVYLALLPFIMLLFGKNVTVPQIVGAVVVTAGLMIGVSDYKRNKVEAIENVHKDDVEK